MVEKKRSLLEDLRENVLEEIKIIKEIISLSEVSEKTAKAEERKIVLTQIKELKMSLEKKAREIDAKLRKIVLLKPLYSKEKEIIPEGKISGKGKEELILKKKGLKETLKSLLARKPEALKIHELERETLRRIQKKKKEEALESKKSKDKKPNVYIKTASKTFAERSSSYKTKEIFEKLRKDLHKTNLQFIPASYISVTLFTTLISCVFAFLLFIFLLFFSMSPELPIITRYTGNIGIRILQTFWVLFLIPFGTFLAMYFYPSMERKSTETRINAELPFATIHMAAISGSIVEPTKIFSIIISTGEYPYLSKEFTKLMNEINVYGYDLVTALRNIAMSSASDKLADLLNGLAITITSGGDLSDFFDKRSQTLLLDYRLDREKRTKSAETFMDIYISVVIAAPMILMLLLIMMKISGLGISLSTSMITLIMILSVSVVNVIFLTFLHLKQPPG